MDIPVAPVIDQGHLKVIVEVITQAGHVTLRHDLTVLVSEVSLQKKTIVLLGKSSLNFLRIPNLLHVFLLFFLECTVYLSFKSTYLN